MIINNKKNLGILSATSFGKTLFSSVSNLSGFITNSERELNIIELKPKPAITNPVIRPFLSGKNFQAFLKGDKY